MKIAVTGANGYIGRNVVKELLNYGHEVVSIIFEGEHPHEYLEGSSVVYADIFSMSDSMTEKEFSDCDALCHLAWQALLRGHNEPGGGFIGGLIAASALAIFGIACGVASVRRAIVFHPMGVSGFGLFLSALAGLPSIFTQQIRRRSERLVKGRFGQFFGHAVPFPLGGVRSRDYFVYAVGNRQQHDGDKGVF